MGKYTSKKENIQEANRLLEKRLIVEKHDGQWVNMETFKTDQENPTEINSDEQFMGGEKAPIDDVTKKFTEKDLETAFNAGQETVIEDLRDENSRTPKYDDFNSWYDTFRSKSNKKNN